VSKLSVLFLSCLAVAVAACSVPDNVSDIQSASVIGGPITQPVTESATNPGPTPSPSPSPTPAPTPQPVPGPLPLAYHADCDGDGVLDCWITEGGSAGGIGRYSSTIRYTSPVTGQTFTEMICNGDYNGTNPADPSDDQPCNAPACSDANGPHPAPDVNFPPSADGPCRGQTAGEVCVPFGGGGSRICDCVTFDPQSGLGDLYPDDTNGDGVNDCPP
jgi:hypothetical protein